MLPDHPSPEDLLADESFINFCRRTSAPDIEKWQRYAAQNDEQRLQVEKARQLFNDLFLALADEDLKEQETILKRKLFAADASSFASANEAFARRRSVSFLLFKVASAAAIVLLVCAYFFIAQRKDAKEDLQSFTVANGERKSFQLADGSLVTLNASSKISIDKGYGQSDRNIFLEGEAFFDVKHNTALPFIVHTAAMDVKALGTAFNVKAYPSERLSEAALIRGLVEVTLNNDDGRKLLLHPNQKVQWDANNSSSNSFQSATGENKTESDRIKKLIQPLKTTEGGDIKEVAWTSNKLIFDDETLGDIAAVFERWYGVKINFTDDDVRNIRFTGTFQKEEIRTVLDYWKESKKFNYTVTPGSPTVITISK